MQECLDEAIKGHGFTKPNPLVGALLYKNNQIIKKAAHLNFGEAHAERNIFKGLSKDSTQGATLFCTLEPCCHTNKKTLPCLPLILDSGVKEVVIAMEDPNPLVKGRSIETLKKNGVKIKLGVLETKAKKLNQAFIKSMQTDLPYIHVKVAQTLDGKIALANGQSQWITSIESRQEAHRMRAGNDAILVSAKTLTHDNPQLNVRVSPFKENSTFKQPIPIILSRSSIQEVPSHILKRSPILIQKELATQKLWHSTLAQIKKANHIQSIFIEPGAQLFSNLMRLDLIDRLSIFIAPTFMGTGKSYEGESYTSIDQLKYNRTYDIKKHDSGDLQLDFYLKEY